MVSKNLDALKIAHGFEVKGTIFYLETAIKAKTQLEKKLFYSLAQEEVQHAQKIDELFGQLSEGGKNKITFSVDTENVEKQIRDFFKTEKIKGMKRKASNIAGYETAMAIEKKSIAAYSAMFIKATDPTEKKFYQMLVDQENKHLDAIMNVYYYLTDHGDWFQEDEGRVWNWMNQ